MIKKIVSKIHLWLGLMSGLVVFVVSITGCLYAFKVEIEECTQPYRFVNKESKSFVLPSFLKEEAEKRVEGKMAHSVTYYGRERAAEVSFYHRDPDYYFIAYLNPYSGEVLKVKNMDEDFFRIVLDGHFYLWLPHEVGQFVVASSTLIFVVMLVTGLVLWWPRGKNAAKQRFSIKWNAKWRRVNYDLHNVLGFYMTWVAIFLALTGLVWGFEWFASSSYWVFSGGKELVRYYEPVSDTTSLTKVAMPEDEIAKRMMVQFPHSKSLEVHFPETAQSSIAVNINPDLDTFWKTDFLYFDRYTLKEIEVGHQWGRFHKATFADKAMRMNYDIHIGAIAGLPGKILVFFASLISASMPITGFLVWWGRKRKSKNAKRGIASTRVSEPVIH